MEASPVMEEGFEGSHDVQDNRGGIESVRSNKIKSCSALWPSNYTRSVHQINSETPSDQRNATKTKNRIGKPVSSRVPGKYDTIFVQTLVAVVMLYLRCDDYLSGMILWTGVVSSNTDWKPPAVLSQQQHLRCCSCHFLDCFWTQGGKNKEKKLLH